jgi:hypothetical protein
VLGVDRRRGGAGGRHLPSTYTIHEAPQARVPERAPAGARSDTGRAGDTYCQGGEPVLPGRARSTGRAGNQYSQGGLGVPAGRDPGTGREGFGYSQGGIPPPSVPRARPLTWISGAFIRPCFARVAGFRFHAGGKL